MCEQIQRQYENYLSQLPRDWEIKEISKLGKVTSGGTPSRDVVSFWKGSIPWLTPGEVSKEKDKLLYDTQDHISASGLAGSSANLLPVNSLMVTTRATIGARAINAVPMATNQGFKSIVFKDTNDAGFYFYQFEKVKPELLRRASGTTFLEISGSEFGLIPLPCPSYKEKTVITQILDSLDTTIRQTEAIIAKLQQVKQGLLHDLLTRGIDANGELRPPVEVAPLLYKESSLGWIPKEWEVVTLGKIAQRSGGLLQTGPFGSQLHAHEYVSDGVPVIMPQDMVDCVLSVEQIARISHRKATILSRHRVMRNDVVFSRRGDLSLCVAIQEQHKGWLCGTGCLLARLSNKEINGHWLALVYRQPFVQTQVMGRAVGSTMANLNSRILGELTVGRPDVTEQNEVVERLQSAAKRIDKERSKLEKLNKQKSGLMDDLLTGRVRVTPLLTEGSATP